MQNQNIMVKNSEFRGLHSGDECYIFGNGYSLKYFDFTVGGEAYKQDWCNQKELLYNYLIPNSNIGKIYTTLIKLKLCLNPFFHSSPLAIYFIS